MQTLEKPARLSLKEILVITELPPWADPAVPYALNLARQHDAKIWIAHAVSPHLSNKVTALPHVGAFCQTWRYELSMAKARHVLLDASDVALKLQFMMHEREFDLVIVSSRNIGAGGLSLGSAARRVLDAADCPILILDQTCGRAGWQRVGRRQFSIRRIFLRKLSPPRGTPSPGPWSMGHG